MQYWGMTLNAFSEQNMKANKSLFVKSYVLNLSVPKTLKVIVFLSFNKGSFIKYRQPLINYFSSWVLALLEP